MTETWLVAATGVNCPVEDLLKIRERIFNTVNRRGVKSFFTAGQVRFSEWI
ncbi:MAG: hypothetical protein V3U90_02450 [Dehalococcoidia bacterium]